MTQFYFAYGSNLNAGDWEAFCARSGFDPACMVPVKRVHLPDNTLVFDYYSSGRRGGAVNIARKIGAAVDGMLFLVTEAGWAALDTKEGHPIYYERETVHVIDEDGDAIEAQTYRVVPAMRGAFHAPNKQYLDICLEGRRAFGLSVRDLESAAEDRPTRTIANVFVYGTLMRGEIRAHAWTDRGAECVLLADVSGRLCDHVSYPGLVLDDHRRIRGEFIRFREIGPVLRALDAIEGFYGFGDSDNLFDRTLVMVHVGNNRLRQAWVYTVRDRTIPTIEEGDWRHSRGRRREAIAAVILGHARGVADFAQRVATEATHSFDLEPAPVRSLRELVDAVIAGEVSERVLARASNDWGIRFGPEALEEARAILAAGSPGEPDSQDSPNEHDDDDPQAIGDAA